MSGTLALARAELLRLTRNKRYFIFTVAFPVVLYLLIGKRVDATAYGVSFGAFYMVSMAMFGAFSGALTGNAQRISQEKKEGWIRQLRLTPLPANAYVISKVIVSMATTVPSIVIVLLLGRFYGNVHMQAWQWVAIAVTIWFGATIFAALAVAIGYRYAPDQVQPISIVVYFFFAILGGLWFPMTGFLQKVGELTPDLRRREDRHRCDRQHHGVDGPGRRPGDMAGDLRRLGHRLGTRHRRDRLRQRDPAGAGARPGQTWQHRREVRCDGDKVHRSRQQRDGPGVAQARAGHGRLRPASRAGHRQPDALVLLRHLARLPDSAGRGAVRPPPRGGVDRRRPGHHGRLLRHLHARPHVLGHLAAAGPVRARGHRRAIGAGLRGVRQRLDAAVDLRVRRHRHGARGRARRAAGGHARGRRGRGLLRLLLLDLPPGPHEHPDRAAARPAHRPGHDGVPDADDPDARAGPGARDGRQAGRERGTTAAGPGHARPDRPVAVDDHAEVRAGRQAAGQAAVLGRARRGPRRTR